MYLRHWSLASRPFDERIDPQWFFCSSVHQGMRTHMRAMVQNRQPIVIVTGGLGVGKSMLVRNLADELTDDAHATTTLHVTPINARDVLFEVVAELQQSAVASQSGPGTAAGLSELLGALRKQLERRAKSGQYHVLFLDAADGLPDAELRSLIRLFRGFAWGGPEILTTFIIGSPQLQVRARRMGDDYENRFPQSILGAMAPADTAAYIGHRIRRAGGDASIFSPDAIGVVHDLTGGVPRRINRLCDLCLLLGFSADSALITESLVWTAQAELRVLAPTRTALARPSRRWRPLVRPRVL